MRGKFKTKFKNMGRDQMKEFLRNVKSDPELRADEGYDAIISHLKDAIGHDPINEIRDEIDLEDNCAIGLHHAVPVKKGP